ncbi:MAG TPA: hypothetical protein DDW52_26650 [Planctomycetaceae bacterium]|nr:hypothetical protein [Planctomycetaceae bacterium]
MNDSIFEVNSRVGGDHDVSAQLGSFVPMAEIRRRVKEVKQGWTPAIARARAAEGERRREQLSELLATVILEESASETDYIEPEFNVVC